MARLQGCSLQPDFEHFSELVFRSVKSVELVRVLDSLRFNVFLDQARAQSLLMTSCLNCKPSGVDTQ